MKRIFFAMLFAALALAQNPPGGGKVAAVIGPRGTTLPASCTGVGTLYYLTAVDGAAVIVARSLLAARPSATVEI